MLTTSASISILFDGAADGALTLPVLPASTLNFVPYINASANVQLNSYSLFANTVNANTVITKTYIQFGDGTRQYTANAGSGGGGGTNSFGQIVANGGTILATTSNDSLQIVGESGITVTSNISAKKVVVSVPAGYTFTSADYGFVYEDTNVIYDYGTL
jgi:hypothetical protein